MPYKGEDITMFILLPPFVDPHSIEYLFERLNADTIEKLVEPSYMSERPVELEVPKFTVEHKLKNLVPVCSIILKFHWLVFKKKKSI